MRRSHRVIVPSLVNMLRAFTPQTPITDSDPVVMDMGLPVFSARSSAYSATTLIDRFGPVNLLRPLRTPPHGDALGFTFCMFAYFADRVFHPMG